MDFDKRFIFHDRLVQLMAREAAERRHDIPDDDPAADEKRKEIKEKLRNDIATLSRYYFGRKKDEMCWCCPYREQVEQWRIAQWMERVK